ncbi:related to RCY1 - F-box protein involved in recycling plasma membrane proteins [Ustilago trichophora]|uniref:Related to RCY1 - F-box protein involved in recycling plasma membrane proteins n=1 Tax=Ustilago trichophora TaxID=86804 RepID=A0A5C3EFN1_9BASI|nr:related to RCY1 - F-box protein involved in recycling plasma membrane proteins [Ustilago trichophora]
METTWAPLIPTTKGSTSSGLASVINGRQSVSGEGTAAAAASSSNVNDVSLDPFSIGLLPSTVIQRILRFVPVSDLPSCALAARSLARFVADERLWAQKLTFLQYSQVPGCHIRYNPDLSTVPTVASRSVQNDPQVPNRRNSSSSSKAQRNTAANNTNASSAFDSNDDEFGDFEAATITSPDDESFGGFVSSKPSQSGQSFSSAPVFSYCAESKLPVPSTEPDSAYQTFKRIAVTLKPFVQSLLFETSPTTSLVFTDPSLSSLSSQAYMICNVARFTGPLVLGSFAKPAKPAHPMSSASQAADASSDPFDQVQWRLRMSIREAADYLEGVLLSAFEGADARRADALRAGQRGMDVSKAVERAEADMHEHATLIWDLAVSTAESSASFSGNFALGGSILLEGENTNFLSLLDHPGSAAALSFLEKRDTLFRSTSHRPEANFTISATQSRPALDFTAMDAFMADVLASLQTDGSLVARVFPPEQQVLLAFASRIANEVVGEYINGILAKARSIDVHLYLQAAAATFSQALKIADTLEKIEPRHPDFVDPAKCRAIVLSMFEAHLDEYLQEERDWVRNVMMDVCNDGDSDATSARKSASVKQSKTMDTAFLASNNPAQVKRNVLSGFKDVLLMPVTVVPRAAGAVGGAVIRTAGTGLSQLNPLKWQQSSAGGARNASGASSVLGTPQRSSTPAMTNRSDVAANNGYVDFSKEVLGGPDGHVVGDDDSDEEELNPPLSTNEKTDDFGGFANSSVQKEWNEKSSSQDVSANTWTASSVDPSVDARGWSATTNTNTNAFTNETLELDEKRLSATQSTEQSASRPAAGPNFAIDRSRFARLQLLLSLDTALSLIQVNRESLKRMEAFMVYPPTTSNGRRVTAEMEEVCLSLFQVLGEQHIAPGFNKATEEIKQWNPLSDGDASSSGVEKGSSSNDNGGAEVLPLVQFFELTHIADTISQLCSVYFSQTLVPVVKLDIDDFLNPVVRAKKAFEGSLDDFVAGGLSVSVDLLMKRAEWILFSQRDPLDYAGNDVSSMAELDSSTKATRSTIEMLRFHCSLLVGATDREILDLFYTEVALRLFGILTKHLKSLQISQTGGFQLISDLNHISAFIASLRSKEPDIPRFYNSLKTLANYYIVDGRELIALLKNKDAAATSARASAREDGFVFGQEELYEFLKSRSDFRQIEKQVDHEIFGFKVSEDCTVC